MRVQAAILPNHSRQRDVDCLDMVYRSVEPRRVVDQRPLPKLIGWRGTRVDVPARQNRIWINGTRYESK